MLLCSNRILNTYEIIFLRVKSYIETISLYFDAAPKMGIKFVISVLYLMPKNFLRINHDLQLSLLQLLLIPKVTSLFRLMWKRLLDLYNNSNDPKSTVAKFSAFQRKICLSSKTPKTVESYRLADWPQTPARS